MRDKPAGALMIVIRESAQGSEGERHTEGKKERERERERVTTNS